MALTDDGCAIRLHGDAHPRGVDRQEGAAVLPGQHASGYDRLPAPAIEAENSVGLRDRVPALDIREFPAIGLTRADIATIAVALQRQYLFC